MTGDTLTYSLTCVQSLMELQMGWSKIDATLVSKAVRILAFPNNLINFCHPEAAILKKLVEADPQNARGFVSGSGTPTGPPVPRPDRFDFNVVWQQMKIVEWCSISS